MTNYKSLLKPLLLSLFICSNLCGMEERRTQSEVYDHTPQIILENNTMFPLRVYYANRDGLQETHYLGTEEKMRLGRIDDVTNIAVSILGGWYGIRRHTVNLPLYLTYAHTTLSFIHNSLPDCLTALRFFNSAEQLREINEMIPTTSYIGYGLAATLWATGWLRATTYRHFGDIFYFRSLRRSEETRNMTIHIVWPALFLGCGAGPLFLTDQYYSSYVHTFLSAGALAATAVLLGYINQLEGNLI